jgi:hypothetical protein
MQDIITAGNDVYLIPRMPPGTMENREIQSFQISHSQILSLLPRFNILAHPPAF